MADDLRQLMLADVTPDGPLGLPARTQSILAWAARAAILDLPVPPASAQPADRRVPDTATTGSSGRSNRGRLRPGDG